MRHPRSCPSSAPARPGAALLCLALPLAICLGCAWQRQLEAPTAPHPVKPRAVAPELAALLEAEIARVHGELDRPAPPGLDPVASAARRARLWERRLRLTVALQSLARSMPPGSSSPSGPPVATGVPEPAADRALAVERATSRAGERIAAARERIAAAAREGLAESRGYGRGTGSWGGRKAAGYDSTGAAEDDDFVAKAAPSGAARPGYCGGEPCATGWAPPPPPAHTRGPQRVDSGAAPEEEEATESGEEGQSPIGAARVVSKAATTADVERVVGGRLGELAACVPAALRGDAQWLTISAVQQPDGRLRVTDLGFDAELPVGAEQCLRAQIEGLRPAPPVDGEARALEIPVLLGGR